MIPIPSPLHPALVHFPIALILLGTVVAMAAVFFSRWHLPWVAAGLLVAGSLGAVAATWTGGNDAELAGEVSPRVDQILEQHEEWGERTRNLALVAAALAVAAASTSRFRKTTLSLGIATALMALASSYAVAETGHYGGQLVYKHAVGINTAAGSSPTTSAQSEGIRKPQPRED